MSLAQWTNWEDIRADLGAWAIVAALGAAGGWFYAHHSIAHDCQHFAAFYNGDAAFQCARRDATLAPVARPGASAVDSVIPTRSASRATWIM